MVLEKFIEGTTNQDLAFLESLLHEDMLFRMVRTGVTPPNVPLVHRYGGSVSYTHLRAHET